MNKIKFEGKTITQRSPAEVYDLWIKALRSGKYNQTEGVLLSCPIWQGQPSYCCLGVLCKLAEKDGGPKLETNMLSTETMASEMVLDGYEVLTPRVRSWLGMSKKQQSKLVKMNDDGFSFKEIADYIEKKIIPVASRHWAKSSQTN